MLARQACRRPTLVAIIRHSIMASSSVEGPEKTDQYRGPPNLVTVKSSRTAEGLLHDFHRQKN